MDAKFVRGSFADVPIRGAVVDINSADTTALVTATTRLAKTLFIGAGVAVGVGVGMALLAALLSSREELTEVNDEECKEPTLPLGSGPVYIKVGHTRSFWGIILDDKLEFVCDEQFLKVPFEHVRQLNNRHRRRGKGGDVMGVTLIEGSRYPRVGIQTPTVMRVATLGGIQNIPLVPKRIPTNGFLDDLLTFQPQLPSMQFRPPKIQDLEALREQLTYALSNNKAAIEKLLGPNVLQEFFNVPTIT